MTWSTLMKGLITNTCLSNYEISSPIHSLLERPLTKPPLKLGMVGTLHVTEKYRCTVTIHSRIHGSLWQYKAIYIMLCNATGCPKTSHPMPTCASMWRCQLPHKATVSPTHDLVIKRKHFLCAGVSPVTDEFLSQRPLTRSCFIWSVPE